MSKADSEKPTPVTVTVAEITSLCDRLRSARGTGEKRLARGSTGASARPRSCGPHNPAHRTCRLGEDVGRGRLRTAHRCEVLPGRRVRAGPLSFVCIEGATEMPEREDDHEALAAGLDIDIGRRIKLRRIQLGLKSKRSRPEDRSGRLPTSAEIRERHRPRVGKPAVSDRRSTWRRVFLRARRRRCRHRHRGRRGLDRIAGRAVRDRGPRMLPRHDARTAQHLR